MAAYTNTLTALRERRLMLASNYQIFSDRLKNATEPVYQQLLQSELDQIMSDLQETQAAIVLLKANEWGT